MKYIKKFEDVEYDNKKYYPLKEIEPFINWFNLMYGKLAELQGWSVYSSDTAMTSWKYPVWQVEKNDDADILKDDLEADNLAKKLGLMLDDMGVVIGYNNHLFIKNGVPDSETLDLYKNVIYDNKI